MAKPNPLSPFHYRVYDVENDWSDTSAGPAWPSTQPAVKVGWKTFAISRPSRYWPKVLANLHHFDYYVHICNLLDGWCINQRLLEYCGRNGTDCLKKSWFMYECWIFKLKHFVIYGCLATHSVKEVYFYLN